MEKYLPSLTVEDSEENRTKQKQNWKIVLDRSFASFRANECFLALKKSVVSAEIHGELHRVEVLKCLNIATKAHVKLPLFAVGKFLELFDGARPGTLQELCQVTRLPCHVRVTSPDRSS